MRLEEVVFFTVGLMSDPTTLVDHVYQKYIKKITERMVGDKQAHEEANEKERLQRLGKDINVMGFMRLLYRESAIKLPGTAYHNQHLNFSLEGDAEPIYLPSKVFGFQSRKSEGYAITVCQSEDIVNSKPVDSIVLTNQRGSTEGLLNAIRRISKLQPMTDLWIVANDPEIVNDEDVFTMSSRCRSIILINCVLPSSRVLDHLFQQISACSTLHTIDVRDTSLNQIECLSLQYLPSLTKLRLSNINLCRFHLLHMAHLVENRKLPSLRELDIGGNNLNSLQDYVDIFLQVVAKHYHTYITIDIKNCNLPITFWKKVRKYMEQVGYLHICGNIMNDGEEQNEILSPAEVFLRKAMHILEPLDYISFADTNLPRHLCGPIIQALSFHGNIIHLDLSGNSLGMYGHHLASTIRTWGPRPSLQELDLSHCSLPVKVCKPLLLVLGRCRNLTELWLPGNTLTGCLHKFLADRDSTLPSLQELFLSYTKLNAQDLWHLDQLIQAEKMPQLRELDLGANGLHRMEGPLVKLVHSLAHHHQRELKLNLYFNNLSTESVRRIKLLCWNTHIMLEFG